MQSEAVKDEDQQDEGAVGARIGFMVDFGVDMHIPLKKSLKLSGGLGHSWFSTLVDGYELGPV